jgi:hypothetical protein
MICEAFKEQANSTWKLLYDARKVYFQFKETTLTDLLLLRLKKDHAKEILITDYSPKEESRTGADWEWWFRGNNDNWLGFRVQAKIINIFSNSFEELHYKNTSGIQCEQLISSSINSTPPRIPIYCLYSNFKRQDILGHWNLRALNERITTFGITIVSATIIRFLRTNKRNPQKQLVDLAQFMFPWHFLVCPSSRRPDNSKYDFAERTLQHWKDTILQRDKETLLELPQEYDSIATVKETPSYIEAILHSNGPIEIPTGISRVTIFGEPMSS